MPILLGIVGAVITILILVRRLGGAGFDPSSLNPFQWYRRHKWRQRYHAKSLYSCDNSLEAAALLLVTTAKCDGDISGNQKQAILKTIEQAWR